MNNMYVILAGLDCISEEGNCRDIIMVWICDGDDQLVAKGIFLLPID
jgi:hypothetical protein